MPLTSKALWIRPYAARYATTVSTAPPPHPWRRPNADTKIDRVSAANKSHGFPHRWSLLTSIHVADWRLVSRAAATGSLAPHYQHRMFSAERTPSRQSRRRKRQKRGRDKEEKQSAASQSHASGRIFRNSGRRDTEQRHDSSSSSSSRTSQHNRPALRAPPVARQGENFSPSALSSHWTTSSIPSSQHPAVRALLQELSIGPLSTAGAAGAGVLTADHDNVHHSSIGRGVDKGSVGESHVEPNEYKTNPSLAPTESILHTMAAPESPPPLAENINKQTTPLDFLATTAALVEDDSSQHKTFDSSMKDGESHTDTESHTDKESPMDADSHMDKKSHLEAPALLPNELNEDESVDCELSSDTIEPDKDETASDDWNEQAGDSTFIVDSAAAASTATKASSDPPDVATSSSQQKKPWYMPVSSGSSKTSAGDS